MLFLLPPSETKAVGGGKLTIQQAALSFGGLNPARDQVLAALLKLCNKPKEAAKVLKLTPKQLGSIDVNRAIPTAPTMPAIQRYTGTLYDAIDALTLTQEQMRSAKESVLIQSALFGLIPATDLIPNYRLSGTTVFPSSDTAVKALPGGLKGVWNKAHPAIFARLANGPLIDLRSKSYADLAPIPAEIPHYWVEVVSRESNGELRALNHFNKLAKGLLIRAVLQAAKAPESIDDLSLIAQSIGMELSLDLATQNLVLVTDQIVKAKRATAN
jgi:cytoplasmic iron level regulating protein YaaA (DUF328/UPF0246 family)